MLLKSNFTIVSLRDIIFKKLFKSYGLKLFEVKSTDIIDLFWDKPYA